jgi:xanthine dehydrogenase accessory factor
LAKWSGFRRRLGDAGHPIDAISRIRCPIGLPEISGKQPAVIAVSVAAWLVQAIQQSPPSSAGSEPTFERTSEPTSDLSQSAATPSGVTS